MKNTNDDGIKLNLTGVEFALVVLIGMIIGAGITLFFVKPINLGKYEKVSGGIKDIVDTYNEIVENYYEDIDEEELANGAIKGMLAATNDPYTTYMDADLYNTFNITLEGSYTGIGVEVTEVSEGILVVGVLSDSPASKAGIKPGDIIIGVDDLELSENALTNFTNYINNIKDESFEIIINRENTNKTFKINKSKVTLKSVASKVFEKDGKKIGYLYIGIFANNTDKQFITEMKSLEEQNIDSLILDLRNNSGGELKSVTSIMNQLFDKSNVMYQTENRDGEVKKFYSEGTKNYDKPIVVLVNGSTASASEVLAAALEENLGATLIGTQTYGKGTVQYVVVMKNGQKYKMTTEKWLTPNGKTINNEGLEPSIKINDDATNDKQLEKAIDYLMNN